MKKKPAEIKAIVFDLDGTLYVSEPFNDTVDYAAAAYVAEIQNISRAAALDLIHKTRLELQRRHGTIQTLTVVCETLGGNIRGLHKALAEELKPEQFLVRDERVVELLTTLAKRFKLYLLTNNNRPMTDRILELTGIDQSLFQAVITIEYSWTPKPNSGLLDDIMQMVAMPPEKVLFVGDRYDIDLKLPAELGCPVHLCTTIEQLLELSSP
jgi:putative hydrolase of the HAD superfamily